MKKKITELWMMIHRYFANGTKENKPNVRYLCDGEKEDCRKINCYKVMGNCEDACKYTKDVRHAKNFQKMLPYTENADFWEKEILHEGDIKDQEKLNKIYRLVIKKLASGERGR